MERSRADSADVSWGIIPLLCHHQLPRVRLVNQEWRRSLAQYALDHHIDESPTIDHSDPTEIAVAIFLAWADDNIGVAALGEFHDRVLNIVHALASLFWQSRTDARVVLANDPAYWIAFREDLRGSLVEGRIKETGTATAVFDRTQVCRQFRLEDWHPQLGYCTLRAWPSLRLIEANDIEVVHLVHKPALISLLLDSGC